jgi:hypothetical protein
VIDRCETCAWYRPHDGGRAGTCRATLPIARDINWSDPDEPFTPEGVWPQVQPSDYCAEWATDVELEDTTPDDDETPTPNRWAVPLGVGVLVGMMGRRRR